MSLDQINPQSAPLRAAPYVRMSTEHQQYSTNNQAGKILEYAQRRNIEIVRTYADEGKSGLSLGGRASLQKLIADVETGVADFTSSSPTLPSSLKTMARRFQPSSKVSSAPWRANTAGNFPPKCLLANAA